MMIRTLTVLAALGFLSACGVDGEPLPVEPQASKTGISISGRAEIGVASRR